MTWQRYKKYRKQLLMQDPHCANCGQEHGVEGEALEFHHVIAQHTGATDHTEGVLLCKRCHRLVTNQQRNEHKQVSLDGLRQGSNPYQAGKKPKRKQSQQVEQLINAFRNDNH